MREILFRGKTQRGEWVEGVAIFADDKAFILNNAKVEFVKGYNENHLNFVLQEVIPETVGQYTGLTDKNGTKIFEGDIIKQTFRLKQTNGCQERDVLSVIEYGISWNYSTVCGVSQRFKDGSGIAMLSVMNGTNGIVDCEIIGNIHDNPELIEKERI